MDDIRVEEIGLPGIGLRHDFATGSGRRVGVLSHRDGHRELLVFDEHDPDSCIQQVDLSREEADTLAQLLGGARISERLAALRRQVEGLVTDEVALPRGSRYDGRPLGDTQARTRTGASIVAVIRSGEVVPSPGPEYRFAGDDVVVVVGTADGTAAVRRILTERIG